MISLFAKGLAQGITEPLVAPLTHDPTLSDHILIWERADDPPENVRTRALLSTRSEFGDLGLPRVTSLNHIDHLAPGDIVALHADGRVRTLFRCQSAHNSLFITDRCNSNCLMCSQPPKNIDDLDYHYTINTQLIPLISPDTPALGITGGEPTLLGPRLPRMLRQLKETLPKTAIHLLSNGRSFAWPQVAKAVAAVAHPDLVVGIPVYSDLDAHHDYIVQAKNAFAQTILGLHQLARAQLRVEIRVVLHRQSMVRLVQLARFISKNLPFAEHVAFMGLEYTGYTPHNDALLYLEPSEYMPRLSEAVGYLDDLGMCCSLYNLPLCLVPEELHKFCRQSISDWKRGYLPACRQCVALERCGGVFETSRRHSALIKPIGV